VIEARHGDLSGRAGIPDLTQADHEGLDICSDLMEDGEKGVIGRVRACRELGRLSDGSAACWGKIVGEGLVYRGARGDHGVEFFSHCRYVSLRWGRVVQEAVDAVLAHQTHLL